jgi:hypothetical protein
MEELNNLENMSFSGSPEYIDVFNDGISTVLEVCKAEVPLSCTCTQNTNPNYKDDPFCSDACGDNPDVPPVTTYYEITLKCAIKVKSSLNNGKSGYTGNLTENGWGNRLSLQYTGANNPLFISGNVYTFSYRNNAFSLNDTVGKHFSYSKTFTDQSASTRFDSYSAKSFTFKVTSMNGHTTGSTVTLSNFITIGSKKQSDTSYIPQYSVSRCGTINMTAITTSIYFRNGNNDKQRRIGTKYQVRDTNGNIAYISGGTIDYITNVSFISGSTYKPNYFYINTSAQTVDIISSHPGWTNDVTTRITLGATQNLSSTGTSNNKLCTLKTIISGSSVDGLDLTPLNSILSTTSKSNNANLVLTHNAWTSMTVSNTTNYNLPTLYSNVIINNSSNTTQCLQLSDIAYFNEHFYVPKVSSLSLTYKNFKTSDAKTASIGSTNTTMKRYFTFYL